MPSHSLRNFEVHKYYQDESKFNGVYSRKALPKMRFGAHLINLVEFE